AARGDTGASRRRAASSPASDSPAPVAMVGLWTVTRLRNSTSIRWAPNAEYAPTHLIIVALDTTTRGGSVAVTDDDRVLALLPGDESRTHGERLPAEIGRALEAAGGRRGRRV